MSSSKNAALAMLTKMGLEDDDIEGIHTIVRAIFKTNMEKRNVKWRYKRLNWEEHIEMLRHTNSFQSRYHMSESSFSRLIDILRYKITVDFAQSLRSTSRNDPIYPELVAGAGLLYLGGDPIKTLGDLFGFSTWSADMVIKLFLDAIFYSDHPLLVIKLPDSDEEAAQEGISGVE
jgi:hypothetical protein